MQVMTSNELEALNGGNLFGFLDGVCGAIGAGGALAWVIGASLGPVGEGAIAACGVYGLARVLTS
jgi:hypothetical protein